MFLHLALEPDHHQVLVDPACSFVLALCCLVYPPKHDPRRRVEAPAIREGGFAVCGRGADEPTSPSRQAPEKSCRGENKICDGENTADEGMNKVDENQQGELGREGNREGRSGGTETSDSCCCPNNTAGGNRFVDSFIEAKAYGPLECLETRRKVLELLKLLLTTATGRDGLRRIGVYEVFRVWHLIESDKEIV